jgi:hypothetical protein
VEPLATDPEAFLAAVGALPDPGADLGAHLDVLAGNGLGTDCGTHSGRSRRDEVPTIR